MRTIEIVCKLIRSSLLVGLAFVFVASAAQAQQRFFLKYPGVDGESTVDTHVNEIDVVNWSQSVKYQKGKPVYSPIAIEKFVDKATPRLLIELVTRQVKDDVVLSAATIGEAGPQDYLRITLCDARISSIEATGSEGDTPPMESVSIKYRGFKLQYTPIDEAGMPTSTPEEIDVPCN